MRIEVERVKAGWKVKLCIQHSGQWLPIAAGTAETKEAAASWVLRNLGHVMHDADKVLREFGATDIVEPVTLHAEAVGE